MVAAIRWSYALGNEREKREGERSSRPEGLRVGVRASDRLLLAGAGVCGCAGVAVFLFV